jgi:hypothetical protein
VHWVNRHALEHDGAHLSKGCIDTLQILRNKSQIIASLTQSIRDGADFGAQM